jgi:hypothetical protein
MQLPSTFATYLFAGVTFYRPLQSAEIVPWFYPDTQYTADGVLGGTQVYLDIGGDSVTTLALRGLCKTAVDRQTLIVARKSTGTVTNSRGHTASATLVKASPVNTDDYHWFYIDLIFVLRPS